MRAAADDARGRARIGHAVGRADPAAIAHDRIGASKTALRLVLTRCICRRQGAAPRAGGHRRGGSRGAVRCGRSDRRALRRGFGASCRGREKCHASGREESEATGLVTRHGTIGSRAHEHDDSAISDRIRSARPLAQRLDATRHGRCSHRGMSTKSKARMARRHPEQVKEVSEKVVAAEIVTGLLSAITFGTIDEGPKSASGKHVSHRHPEA